MTTPSRPALRSLDWTAVRSRMAEAMEQTEAHLKAAQQDSDEQSERRSPHPAVDVSTGRSEEATVGVVIFMLAERRFALEIRYVCEIVSKARISPLPGMPAHACGVYDLRGQLLPAFNLLGPLDLPRRAGVDDNWAIVCGQEQPEFLILSEAAPEILMLPLEEIGAAEPAPGIAWQWATMKNGLVIVDGRLLLDDRRFYLDDEQTAVSDETESTEFQDAPIGE
ncbi:chemotaxis protein CheW [Sinorhizobium medicae]|nr:chemotaxis protein CheW [Sinorhizobium medicae]MDX0633753.1 chemotaxis protein CheW [Sinorhizobium medicae]